MKKKNLLVLVLALTASISLASCSFLDSLIDDSGKTTDPTNPPTPVDDSELVLTSKVDTLELNGDLRQYRVNDIFVIPDVTAILENGQKLDVNKYITVKEEPDLSKPTEPGKYTKATVQLIYTINKEDGGTARYSLTTSYNITVFNRNDYHYDPSDDEEIRTLDISNVKSFYYEGESFVKPTIKAIKYDGSKVDVTDSSSFIGYNIDVYGNYTVEVSYLSHVVSYDIMVINREENSLYPAIINSSHLNITNYLAVRDEVYRIYVLKTDSKGETFKVGNGFNTFFNEMSYHSEDENIATVDEYGYIRAINPGTTYIYFDFNDGMPHTFRSKITVEEKELKELTINSYRYTYYSGSSFNFAGTVNATYQNGYEERINPTIDDSNVNTDVPGKYTITVSYTINGVTLSEDIEIEILDASLYKVSKTHLDYDVSDYNRHTPIGATALPHHGTLKSLVVPVKFNDSDDFISNYENVREDINAAFFGTNEETGWRSVKTYYEEESFGEITYTGTTSEIYYDSAHSSDDFRNGDYCQQLKIDILDWYFANHPEEDIKDYDVDHDGYFDSLNLIFLAPDAVASKIGRDNAPNLWAMVKNNNNLKPDVNKPVSNSYLWASYDFIYPNKEIALARTGKSEFSQNMSKYYSVSIEARTFIHETGHMFGIDDYYSYSEDGVYFAGHANMQTSNILGHDPYSVMQYNWAEPYIPVNSTTISIGDFQKTHDVILLTPEWNEDNSPYDEYFLVDLYVPTSGLNEFDGSIRQVYYDEEGSPDDLNTMGIRIWHVDARLATYDSSYKVLTTNPVNEKMQKITDNSYGQCSSGLEDYDRFMELQLVRNKVGYDYRTAYYLHKDEYFQVGDIFNMDKYSSQFVSGNKMDNGLDLGWSIEVKGIYLTEDGYSADIEVNKL